MGSGYSSYFCRPTQSEAKQTGKDAMHILPADSSAMETMVAPAQLTWAEPVNGGTYGEVGQDFGQL